MNITRFGILTLFITQIFACSDDSPSPKDEPDITLTSEFRLAQSIDNYLNGKIDSEDPGLTIIVRENNEIVYQTAHGLANKNSGLLIDAETPFNLTALSKPFTAVAIMQLVEDQKINLSDSVRIYLPKLPSLWQDVTIDHLLTHQSGSPKHYGLKTDEGNNVITNLQLIDFLSTTQELDFQPGSEFHYQTTGYILLAQVVASVSETDFDIYMNENIFTPANMNNSSIISNYTREHEYWSDDMALSNADDDKIFFGLFNGGIGQVSSLNDINTFTTALLSGDLISTETLALMLEPQVKINSQSDWSYGWQIQNYNGRTLVRHIGILGGYSSGIEYYLDDKVEVIILTNGGEVTTEYRRNITNLVREHFALWPPLSL